MQAEINTLYQSDFYRIMDFRCRCRDCNTSKPEYSRSFSISFVRKGNFLFNVFRHSLDSYTGCVLITKPGFERTVTHIHTVPDECTIFDFTNEFTAELTQWYGNTKFFQDRDLHSTLVRTNAELDFLHAHISHLVTQRSATKLQVDNLVMEVIRRTLNAVTDYQPDHRINARLKKNHLATIEQARHYITTHFTEDISLVQIARHCLVSPFHFSRIFKTFTGHSPHQFLLTIRLQHAALLLRDSDLPVADIAFLSGFNSIEHFTACFREKHNCPPTVFRSGAAVLQLEKSKIS